jgi:hypothetical protein
MVYLPTPLSPAPESREMPTTDSHRGPSEPVPSRLNGQSLVQSHHDDPDANQIALATNQNQIQTVQSHSSPRISCESVRLSTLFKLRNESESTHILGLPLLSVIAPGHRSNQVCPLTGNCTVCAQNGSSRTTPRGNSRRDLLLCESSNPR